MIEELGGTTLEDRHFFHFQSHYIVGRAQMTDDELLTRLRQRALEPATRKDSKPSSAALLPPATEEMIEFLERAIGTQLPSLVRRMYLEIANGGFGPGAGLLPIRPESELPWSLLATYQDFQRAGVPKQLVPLWDWGDAVWSCIDTQSPNCAVVTHDDVDGAIETGFGLHSWLTAWVCEVNLWNAMYQDTDAIMLNPFTNKPMKTKVRGKALGRRWLPGGGREPFPNRA